MKNNTVKKVIAVALTAGVVLLSGCQNLSDTSDLQNMSYIGSEESSIQNIYSEQKQPEFGSVQTASDSGSEHSSVQSTYSDSKSEKSESTVQSTPDSTEQNQYTHTVSESSVSGNGQETSSTDTEQSTVSNIQTAPEQTVSSSKPIASESVPEQTTPTTSETNPTESTEDNVMETNELYIKIGENTLTAVLEDNRSTTALKELLADKPLTISASNYGGFEKVCALGTSLPRNDVQTTTHAGDICLYSGNQIVIFYGSNSWSYTRLGKISGADSSELERILSGTETELTLSLKPFD